MIFFLWIGFAGFG